jgi:hypothetical protein
VVRTAINAVVQTTIAIMLAHRARNITVNLGWCSAHTPITLVTQVVHAGTAVIIMINLSES